jgi:hypothetical protein
LAPTIHPIAPVPPPSAHVSALSVAVTLTFREFFPIPRMIQKARNRVLIVGLRPSFRAIQTVSGFWSAKRYHGTKFRQGFKSLLTLLELAGVNLHDEKNRA